MDKDIGNKAEELTAEEAKKQFEELIASPISKDEADKGLAEVDIKRTQLAIIRQKWLSQAEAARQQLTQIQQKISMLDEEILNIELERAVIFRRALNVETASEENSK
jgi:hypothetical protein